MQCWALTPGWGYGAGKAQPLEVPTSAGSRERPLTRYGVAGYGEWAVHIYFQRQGAGVGWERGVK